MNTSWRLDWGTAACLLAAAVAAALLLSGCAEAAIGKHEIGENDAQDALGDTGVTVPDVFKFGRMIEDRVGVSGKNTYYGRYDAATDQFTAAQALMSANPEFPAFRSIDCEVAEGTGGVGLADVGLSCVDTTQSFSA